MSVAQFSGAFTPTGSIELLLCWFIWGEVRTHHLTAMRIKEANSSRSRSHSASDTGSGPGHGGIVGKLNPNKQTPRKPPQNPMWWPTHFNGVAFLISGLLPHYATHRSKCSSVVTDVPSCCCHSRDASANQDDPRETACSVL